MYPEVFLLFHNGKNWMPAIRSSLITVLQMKHILFVGKNTARYRRHKNAPSNAKENQTMLSWQELGFALTREKGAQ